MTITAAGLTRNIRMRSLGQRPRATPATRLTGRQLSSPIKPPSKFGRAAVARPPNRGRPAAVTSVGRFS
eukprot:6093428-Pyramimonas_sp.AAC.1